MREIIPLVSFPRSGNTWMRVLLANCIMKEPERLSELGLSRVTPTAVSLIDYEFCESQLIRDAPILIKEHYNFTKMPYNNFKKAIYIYRNKYECLRSYWTYTMKESPGLYPNCRTFLKCYDDYAGTWEHHIESWKQAINIEGHDVLLIKYEDLIEDSKTQLKRCCDFMNINIADEKLEKALENSNKDTMAKTLKVGNIFLQEDEVEFRREYDKIMRRNESIVLRPLLLLEKKILNKYCWHRYLRHKVSKNSQHQT